jgi:hypothetical protein
MARTINEIFADKMNRVAADATLGPLLTSTSKVAIYRLLLYISAVCDWTLETLHDLFKKEVNETIASLKPHSPQWYAEKAKAFQYGYNLNGETDGYDNIGLTDSQIEASKIVAYAAVVEQPSTAIRIRIKVAKKIGDDLGPLTTPELNALRSYFQRIKDAGVKLGRNGEAITSGVADSLMLALRVKYVPLVLNSDGERIDGQDNTPAQRAIRAYLENLPFNGVFSVAKLEDAIQKVDGIDDVKIDQVLTRYGLLPFTTVDIDYIPDSGYLRIADADLSIQFIPA